MDAIMSLTRSADAGSGLPRTPGFYSRKYGMIVTDRYGNAVSDGTVVNLGLLDSVIASGSLGRTTTDSDIFEHTDGGVNLATDSVTRNGVERTIQPNDRVVLFNARAEDKSRFVSGNFSAGSLEVHRIYQNTRTGLEYAIGASLLGTAVYGVNKDQETPYATKGTVKTKDGLAELRLVCPASGGSEGRIHLGGLMRDPADSTGNTIFDDPRHAPAGSARLIFAATSSDDSASMVDEGFVCASILPWELSAAPGAISRTETITIRLTDSSTAGDRVALPFVPVNASVKTKGMVTVTPGPCVTDVNGVCSSLVTVTVPAAGTPGFDPTEEHSAAITYRAGETEVSVEYKLP
jgi:hypothetical protein